MSDDIERRLPNRARRGTGTGNSPVDGPVATLSLDVAEDGGVRDGYKLKLNSYDLGVDIELHDAVQRIRFEHPEVRTRRRDERQGPRLLLRRQHLHARRCRATRGR